MNLNNDVDTKNPWVTLSSNILYENQWIKLRKNDVITPRGDNGEYTYIDKKGAVGAVVLNSKNEIYLVGQYRYAMNEYTWEIIEGGIEEGESYLNAIKREMKEEAGITASNYQVLMENVHISNSVTNERGVLYLVRDVLEEGNKVPDPTEKIIVKKVPFNEVVNLVYQGKIVDLFSIAGILLAAKELNI